MLDRRQQQIAHSYGRQIVCLIARCSFGLSHVKSTMWSVSDFPVGQDVYWMETTAKGIQLRDGVCEDVVELLRWTDLMRHINALPESLRTDAAEADRTAHRPPGWPSRPGAHIDRPSEASDLARAIWDDYVRADTRRILDAAFPLAGDTEPVDLLDLIGAST